MKNQKGQTLLEVLIAIFILVFGIISIVSLSITSNIMSRRSSEELVAVNLAREGIEVARQIRDSNWLEKEAGGSADWNDGLYDLSGGVYDYSAIASFDPVAVAWTLDWVLNDIDNTDTTMFLTSDNIYVQGTSLPAETINNTMYKRIINLNPICDGDEIITSSDCLTAEGTSQIGVQVISTVQWENSNKINEKVIEEKIYEWKY